MGTSLNMSAVVRVNCRRSRLQQTAQHDRSSKDDVGVVVVCNPDPH